MRPTIVLLLAAGLWCPGICRAGPAGAAYLADLRAAVPAVRGQAAVALGRLGDPAAVPALAAALQDPEPGVRREAARALGLLRDVRAVAPLSRALADPDANVRFYAAYALGEIKDPKAAGALLQALRDPEWCVRDQAAWALRELSDPSLAGPLVAALVEGKSDEAHLLWLLRHAGGPTAIQRLAEAMTTPEAGARRRVVAALAEIHGPAAVEPLITALKDADAGVRRRAVEALADEEDPRAVEALRKLAVAEKDPAVRALAADAGRRRAQQKGLVAHWSFDEGSATVAKDVTGRGSDGEILGCEPAPGKVGRALRFGPGKYVELGRPTECSMGGTPLTVMAWVKSEAPNGVVVARGGAYCGFSLYVKEGAARFGIHQVKDDPAYIAAAKDPLPTDWVHLAGVIRADRVEVYVNGKLAGTEKTPGLIPSDGGQGMEIGFDAQNSPAEITDSFVGVIDEVKVFHAALGEAEIAREMRAASEGSQP